MGYSPDEIEQLTGFKQGQYKFLSSELDEGQELNEKSGLDWQAHYDPWLENGEASET